MYGCLNMCVQGVAIYASIYCYVNTDLEKHVLETLLLCYYFGY